MPVIKKKPNFFRENYFKVFGTVWLLIGGVGILVDNSMFLGYLYLIMGLGYFIAGYIKRNQTKAYIEWDEEKLVFSDWFQKPVSYPLSSIDALIISRENLTIKSGAANGTMVDLKGYKEEDIQFLSKEFNSYLNTRIEQLA